MLSKELNKNFHMQRHFEILYISFSQFSTQVNKKRTNHCEQSTYTISLEQTKALSFNYFKRWPTNFIHLTFFNHSIVSCISHVTAKRTNSSLSVSMLSSVYAVDLWKNQEINESTIPIFLVILPFQYTLHTITVDLSTELKFILPSQKSGRNLISWNYFSIDASNQLHCCGLLA